MNMKLTAEQVYRAIRNIREANHLTQEELADMMGISQSSYARNERGATNIDLNFLERFAKVMNMDLLDVMTYPDIYVKYPPERDEIRAIIQIELKKEKKDKVLRLIFGDEELTLLK